ncbi:MAG: hypothetical protein ABH886_04170 [Candidatus Desantisbacteria bacterium]
MTTSGEEFQQNGDEISSKISAEATAICDLLRNRIKWMLWMGVGIVAILSGLMAFLKFG